MPVIHTTFRYVALSSNEKTNFKARELKSVHVDAVGQFVKFVIHKNHVNKYNLYNQVSTYPTRLYKQVVPHLSLIGKILAMGQ